MIATICPAEHQLLPLASGDEAGPGVHEHVASCSACRAKPERLAAEIRSLRRDREIVTPALSSGRETPEGQPDRSVDGDAAATKHWNTSTPDPLIETASAPKPTRAVAGIPARIGKYLVVGYLGGLWHFLRDPTEIIP